MINYNGGYLELILSALSGILMAIVGFVMAY